MDSLAYERYKWIHRKMEEDEEFLYLQEKLREAGPDFQAAMEALSPEHRQSVTEYLGILGELYDRMTEISCCVPK